MTPTLSRIAITCCCGAGSNRPVFAIGSTEAEALAAVAIAVLGVLADVLDRHHMLILGGVEHDDALGRAARDPDTLDRTADQLALVGHQHDLIGILDRE